MEEYIEPILSNEGIECLKQLIKRSGMDVIYINITKRVGCYYCYCLHIHSLDDELIIPFAEKSELYEIFKNMEINKDYLPKELGLWLNESLFQNKIGN